MQNSEKIEDEGITWLTCAGQLKVLVNEVKECDLVLDAIKTEQFPNPVVLLINSVQKVRTIQNIADTFLRNASDSAYCLVCFLFPNGPDREFFNNAWVTEGVRVWHKMKRRGKNKPVKLSEHFSCSAFKAALRDYCNFIKTSCHIDILFDQSNREKSIQIQHEHEYNKQVITIFMDTAHTLAGRGWHLRHCNVIRTWLENKSMRPYHVTYLGSGSQNEFIELLSLKTRNRVIEEVKNAEMYSVLADTTPDITHQDKLATCVRYVDNNGNVKERLLEINECTDKTGFGIAKNIYDTLVRNELNPGFIAFQSDDFASSMSGQFHVAQKELSKLATHHISYIPRQAHRINTFSEDGCNASVIIFNLIGNLESLYVFFNASIKRYGILSKKLSDIEGSLQLCNLSKTQWAARTESVKAVWISFEIIFETLQEISFSNLYDRKTKNRSIALFKKITTFDFIVQ
ncbi:hypothetical protein QTP88_008017 [Uroleucon formosanum]